ncbi:hypothetical protein [Methylovulum psychrotolerans]|uniref:Uncharacterized protein n=1 Tax=Methylovulum psychrotolerans TaxID=1704499 RepID=A0A2S5CJC3_9GAMM|nr:hypothetical protein [Methylovulum psychrotolerans]POZ50842.1 hypothetical protein AADEFJLK_03314 [Methylovulum psychrotolerans]
MQAAKKIAVVGSSHVTWWELAIERRQIPQPLPAIVFIGRSAMPIWADYIQAKLAAIEDQVDEVFVFLGDLRFGNKILTDGEFIRTGATSGSFLYIDKDLISDANDKIMLGLTLSYLQQLSARLGSKLRILFWSSTFREYYNLETGRYGGRGNYRHPVWNLAELIAPFGSTAIDTTGLTALPIDSYFLDGNGHCTSKGYAFIYRLLAGQRAVAAYQSVYADFASWGHLLFPSGAERYKVNITGASIAFKTLLKAVRTDYFKLPAQWAVNEVKTCKTVEDSYDVVVYLSGLHFQDEDQVQIHAKIAEEKANLQRLSSGGSLCVIFWDQWAREIVAQRPEYRQQFLPKHPDGRVRQIEQAFAPYEVKPLSLIPFVDADGMVECGSSFEPTTKGFAALFHLIITEDMVTAFARYHKMAGYCLNQAYDANA